MGSIGGYKYPSRSSDEMVEIADVLVNEHGGSVSSEETFAQDIGHSSKKSGAYKQKMADARKFGILPSRGIESTDLSFRLANPKHEEEKRSAMFQMFQNIQLLEHLYEHLNGKHPPDEFWRVLMEMSDVNPKEAKEAAEEVEDLYREMLRYDSSDEAQSEPSPGREEGGSQTSSKGTPEAPDDGIFIKIGNDTLSLDEVSTMNLELAKVMLEQKIEQIKSQNSPSKNESDPVDQNLNEFSE